MGTSGSRPRGGADDLRDIRQRGKTYQVRVFVGYDPLTGKQIHLSGSASTLKAAVRMRDKYRTEVAQNKVARTAVTVSDLLQEWLANHEAEASTLVAYRSLADKFIIPAMGDVPLTRLARTGAKSIEQLYADLRRCRRRCKGGAFVEHHSTGTGTDHRCDGRCRPHTCKPLAKSSLRQTHAVLSGAMKAAVRWGWITTNPLDAVSAPRAAQPRPNPPSQREAAALAAKAWAMDADWGTFVWLLMITGARRGEIIALHWHDVTLRCAKCDRFVSWNDDECVDGHALDSNRAAVVEIKRGYTRVSGKDVEKDTKTHQMRRIALDVTTTDVVVAHRRRYETRIRSIGLEPSDVSYLFSYAEDHSRPCSPTALTHKYAAMAQKLGIDTHLHALRHYSATELLAAGVDLRTVAGRLGHGGGGATTLKVYAAWVQSADEQAAELLAARLPSPPKFRP
jgi:integrase